MAQKKVGEIVISLSAGTASFIADMDKANAGVKNFGANAERMGGQFRQSIGGHAVPQMAAASAAIRTLEGNFNNNIRAAERFLGTTLGLSNALQAAFPVVGATAFLGVIYELTTKAHEFYLEYTNGAAKAKLAFAELNTEARLHNDALAVANDRLGNEIAKLSGKPGNGLKLALDEARESADKLAASLDKSLKGLYKVLQEGEISKINAFFTGREATDYIRKTIGGNAGVTEAIGKVSDITYAAQDRIEAAKTPEEANAIRAEVRAQAKAVLEPLEKQLRAKLAEAVAVTEPGRGFGSDAGPFKNAAPDLNAVERAQLQGAIRAIAQQRKSIDLNFENGSLLGDKAKLEAAKSGEGLTRPFENKMALMVQQLNTLRGQVAAAGGTEAEKTLAKGYSEGLKVVVELNNHLKRQHSQLSDNERAAIMATSALIAQEEARAKFLEKVDSEVAKTKERIAQEEMLAKAIGKTFEVTRAATIDARVLGAMGLEKYNNPDYAAQRKRLESTTAADFDSQHASQVKRAIDQLNVQIEMERELARVQADGADAIRAVTLAYRLRELAAKGATAEQLKAEVDLAKAQRETASAGSLAAINAEISAAQRLTRAYTEGASAVREMQIQLRGEAMRKGGASQGEIDAEAARMRAEHEHDVTVAALGTGMAYKNQLDSIREQIAKLQQLKAEQGDSLEIAISMKNLQLEQTRVIRDQVLAIGTAKDGWRQFWSDMKIDSESAAKKMYDTLSQAVSGVNDNLAKFLTGQKTSWGSFFQGLGERLIKLQIEQVERQVLGGISGPLGKVFGQQGQGNNGPWSEKIPGIGILGGKRDGSSPTRALYVTMVQDAVQQAQQQQTQGKPGFWASIFGSLIGGAMSALGGLKTGGGGDTPVVTSTIDFPQRANGGPVAANVMHLVGERGPELFMPRQAGTIIPNSALASAPTHHYNITVDARGADEEAVERRTLKAVQMAHASAINTAVQATFEIQKRRTGR